MASFVIVFGDHLLPANSAESAVFYKRSDDWFLSFTYKIASLPYAPGSIFFEEELTFNVGPPKPLLRAACTDSRGRLVGFSSQNGRWAAPLACAIDAGNIERHIARIGGRIIDGFDLYYGHPYD